MLHCRGPVRGHRGFVQHRRHLEPGMRCKRSAGAARPGWRRVLTDSAASSAPEGGRCCTVGSGTDGHLDSAPMTPTGPTLRERLVAAGVAFTTEQGWSQVTMARLAEAVGVSRQTVYNEIGT